LFVGWVGPTARPGRAFDFGIEYPSGTTTTSKIKLCPNELGCLGLGEREEISHPFSWLVTSRVGNHRIKSKRRQHPSPYRLPVRAWGCGSAPERGCGTRRAIPDKRAG
jgi:hypothetical protein